MSARDAPSAALAVPTPTNRLDRLPAPRDRVSIGTSLRASPICLGMITRPEMIPAAYDAGINFFFVSCDLHWPLYEAWRCGMRMLLSRGGGVRSDIVVAVATYMAHPPLMTA